MNLSAVLPYILQLLTDAMGNHWGPLMVLISSWAVQLLTQASSFPISLPASWNTNVWKPVVVVIVSVAQGVIVSIVQGHSDPVHAVLLGLQTAMWTMGLWALTIKAIYNGKPPQWLNYLSLIFPTPQPLPPPLPVSRTATTLSAEDFPPKERPTNPDGTKP
jgi:hypothetical protein